MMRRQVSRSISVLERRQTLARSSKSRDRQSSASAQTSPAWRLSLKLRPSRADAPGARPRALKGCDQGVNVTAGLQPTQSTDGALARLAIFIAKGLNQLRAAPRTRLSDFDENGPRYSGNSETENYFTHFCTTTTIFNFDQKADVYSLIH